MYFFENGRFVTGRFEDLTFCKPDVLQPDVSDVLKPDFLKPDVLKPGVLWVYLPTKWVIFLVLVSYSILLIVSIQTLSIEAPNFRPVVAVFKTRSFVTFF
jgi:hypothetical protein